MPELNYLDSIASDILRIIEGPAQRIEELPLYRLYALLALAKGADTTNNDVHDAWAAHTSTRTPGHHSIVPYGDLTPEVQELDTPFTLAIRQVAMGLPVSRRWC